jgi:nucleotidyltransferase substrate binding protein (TIGR01987 family)
MESKTSHISVNELTKAVATLVDSLDFADQVRTNEVQFKIARDACIKRFDYCIELSWKVSAKKLGSNVKFPKPAIREMARADLIESAETWLDFIEARNSSSHSYDEETAVKVFAEIVKFRPEVFKLIKKLKALP